MSKKNNKVNGEEGSFIGVIWSEIDYHMPAIKIVGITLLAIFSVKWIGDSLYKDGFNCIENTLAEAWRFDILPDEIGEKENYRKAKLICLEKIYGKNYSWKKSKEHEQKSKEIIEYFKSDEYQKLEAESSNSERYRDSLERSAYYHHWSDMEYSQGRYPESSHYDFEKHRAYLNKLKERNYKRSDDSVDRLEQKRKDRLEFGF